MIKLSDAAYEIDGQPMFKVLDKVQKLDSKDSVCNVPELCVPCTWTNYFKSIINENNYLHHSVGKRKTDLKLFCYNHPGCVCSVNYRRFIQNKTLKNLPVKDRRFVGSGLTFSNPVKTDGPVETVQLRTRIKWVVRSPSDRYYCIILIQH
jgi:hypothetical protein